MTIPNLRLPRITHSGTRGCGVSRGTPGYQPRHAAPVGADAGTPGLLKDATQPQPAVEVP